MSFTLWKKLPRGFLKKQYKAWNRLDYEVKELIVALAEEQKFKCVAGAIGARLASQS